MKFRFVLERSGGDCKNVPGLKEWGIQYESSLSMAVDFSCPHCKTQDKKFSYFCRGNFLQHAAMLWRGAVVGFTPIGNGSEEIAGIAVFRCSLPACMQFFALRLSWDVIESYKMDCPSWPK